MAEGKRLTQCVTPGCGRKRNLGDLCEVCTRRARRMTSGTYDTARKEVRAVCHPTGLTRRGEYRAEAEMTDGRQRWWVGAQGAA